MHTYTIHINGLVQGVGFRPHVYRIAKDLNIKGWVNNSCDGVHIQINADKKEAEAFLERIIKEAPLNAIITHTSIQHSKDYKHIDFTIQESSNNVIPNVLVTPDYAICEDCKKEIDTTSNKRHAYPFTTCLQCGPRYSIVESLPYDRHHTTMHGLQMCLSCEQEYYNIQDRRHFSQTNSCPECTIPMHLFNSSNTCINHNNETIINALIQAINKGKIIAVKNTGGYLLVCDATNQEAIQTLRLHKRRPSKPLAVLYPNIEMMGGDIILRPIEVDALLSTVAPIVLCKLNTKPKSGIVINDIAPNLDKLGVMLPSSSLLYILSTQLNKPLIATSGNLSGSPIIYKDVDALENLFDIADLVLTYDRAIVSPQDDSVILFTEKEQQIILRRSRGLAPNYFPVAFETNNESILATGGELKSAFAFSHQKNLYISQFLGDQTNLESQEAFANTFKHFQKLFKSLPEIVLIDKHPNYFVSNAGKEIANTLNLSTFSIQHHKAHFASVLAEHHLLNQKEKVLGFIWDGTGYGEDGQIWGSELFSYYEGTMNRMAHLKYFPILLGDKMSKEPRLSALSLLSKIDKRDFVKKQFTDIEWNYYQQLLEENELIQTCSMGRFMDAIACIIGINSKSSFEGEAPMQLEALARNSYPHKAYYSFIVKNNIIEWEEFVNELLLDIAANKEKDFIARKVINGLVELIYLLSDQYKCNSLAFSGGVFQNALLVDTIIGLNISQRKLYFHKHVSPNDEGISLGQMAYYVNEKKIFKDFSLLNALSNNEQQLVTN